MPIAVHPVTRYLKHDRYGHAWQELARPLHVDIPLGVSGGLCLIVPSGFQTDFASVPRFFWRVLPPNGPYLVAAIVHDWLYSSDCSRFLADSIFRELMHQTGVPAWKRIVIYYAVRTFGGYARKIAQQKRKIIQ